MSAAGSGAGDPRILVVIVNYRTAGLVVDCLRSAAPEITACRRARVVVVENASGDDSTRVLAEAIAREGWSSWVELRVEAHNGGFAAGNNAAIAPALAGAEPPDFVWLLNPDTIVRPGALSELLAFAVAHPDVGIVGSRLEYEDGTQHDSRYRFPTLASEFDGALRLGIVSRLLKRWEIAPPLVQDDHPIDWVAGASMLVRRAVFDSIGLMDEGYFLYYEETDFCLRARRAGFPCWYAPKSRVAHLVGRSSGLTNLQEPARRRPRYWFESRRRYFRKNHGRVYAFLTDVAFALGFGVWRIRRGVQRKPDTDPPRLWSDFVRFTFLGGLR